MIATMRSFEDFKLDDVAVIFVFGAILCMRMRNYSVLRLILPIIQHLQDAAYYKKLFKHN